MFIIKFQEIVEEFKKDVQKDKPALTCYGQTLTYLQLNDAVENMARHLNTMVPIHEIKNKRIALVMPKCIEHYVAVLLLWRLEASIVFVRAPNFNGKTKQWEFHGFEKILAGENNNPKIDGIIAHSRYDSIFSQNEKFNKITFYPDLYEEYEAKAKPVVMPVFEAKADGEAYIVYTSGTTGEPKGAINTHEGLDVRNQSHINALNLDASSVVAQDRPLHIDASLQEIMMTWCVGGCLVVVPEQLADWSAYIDFYNENKITHAIVVPSILKQIYELNKDKNPFITLKYILTTGESMSEEIYQYFDKHNKTIVNGYGPSEANIGAFLWTFIKNRGISIGTPMQDVVPYIVPMNNEGIVLENNKIKLIKEDKIEGQLMLSGLGIGRGYTNNAQLTRDRFRYFHPVTKELFHDYREGTLRCYLTGDKVSLNRGLYYIHGRYDRQLKLDGKLLFPEEIEYAIKQFDEVETAQVDVVKDNASGRYQLIAGVKFKEKHKTVTFEKIQNTLRENLGYDKVPTLWKQFEVTLPQIGGQWKNAPLFSKPVNSDDFKPAGIEVEITTEEASSKSDEKSKDREKVIRIFESVIPNASKYPHIAFQFLGGTSILSMLLAGRMYREFNINATREQLFNSSINDTVVMIEAHKKTIEIIHLNADQCKNHPEPSVNLPVFFIHALLGDARNDYDRFAKFFSQRSIYGISAISANQPGNLDEYAQHYKKAIQENSEKLLGKKGGPYILVGWSSGGVIAHRVCELLREEGHDVGLFLLDSTSGHYLSEMELAKHKEYAITLAKLTGRFLAEMLTDEMLKRRYKAKVERISLSEGLTKEQQIDCAFRQLESINEDFKKPQIPAVMDVYFQNAKVIRDAWSIALGVLHYKDVDCKDAERQTRELHDRAKGARHCRLFYAEVDKEKELGTKVNSHLGWEIGDAQITSLPGTHLSMMSKIDKHHHDVNSLPAAFKKLVTELQQGFQAVTNKYIGAASNSSASSSASRRIIINSSITGGQLDNVQTAAVINNGAPNINSAPSDQNLGDITITATVSGRNVRIRNMQTAGVINNNMTQKK